ncbi:hypothetical protein [Amycolatopsis sp. BJA-103]|uniref:hypothetical protein n=1 Tax=Amycolatopsis sp. BJA-103 TaxID=1911175 RepID=UPI001E38B5FD|nr:hypothetical protein [Amycolatopsis sp. BJA-103]
MKTEAGRAVAGTTVSAALGLGAVVVFTAVRDTSILRPLIALAAPRGWPSDLVLVSLVPLVAVLAAVFLTRWWPWLLVAGVVLSLPTALVHLVPDLGGHPSLTIVALAGPPVVLLAVLAAAQELLRRGARTAGLVLIGLTVGTQLFAASLAGASWLMLATGGLVWHLVLTALSVAGAVLAVVTRGSRAQDPEWPEPRPLPARFAAAAILAVLLPMAVGAVDVLKVSEILELPVASIGRHAEVVVAIGGLIVLVGGVVACAIAGSRAFFAAATSASVQVGAMAPLLLAVYSVAFQPVLSWLAAAVGVAAGCLVGASRWRVQFAVGGAAMSALVLFIVDLGTGGVPEKLIDHDAVIPGALLLALLCATVVSVVVTTGPRLAEDGVVVPVLGPLVSVLVFGGAGAMAAVGIRDQNAPSTRLEPVHHLGYSAGLLLLAAALVAGIAAVDHLRARSEPEAVSV